MGLISLPIMMRLKHVKERADERHTRKDFVNNTLYTTLAMALAMCKIAEDRYGQTGPKRIPIVLPALDGLYLGELNPARDADHTNNRMMIYKNIADAETERSRYKWIPHYKANIWTYIGMKEMRPDQKRLQSTLSGFLNKPKANFLCQVMDDFLSTHNFDAVHPVNRDPYLGSMASLRNVMNGDLWKSSVYLPGQRGTQGLRFPVR